MLIPVTAKVLMLSIGCISGRLILIGRRERIGWDKTDGGTERGRWTWNVERFASSTLATRSFQVALLDNEDSPHTAYSIQAGSTGGGLSVSLSSLKPIRTGRISKLRIRRDPIGFLKKKKPSCVCYTCMFDMLAGPRVVKKNGG